MNNDSRSDDNDDDDDDDVDDDDVDDDDVSSDRVVVGIDKIMSSLFRTSPNDIMDMHPIKKPPFPSFL